MGDLAMSRPEHTPSAERSTAWGLLEEGHHFVESRQLDRALETFDAVMLRFAAHPDPYTRSVAADALIGKAWVLEGLDRVDEALTVFEEAVGLAGDAADPDLRSSRAFAEYGRGYVLNRLGCFEDAAVALADFFNAFVHDPPAGGIQPVVDAELLLGGLALHFGHPDKAIETYDDLVDRFGRLDSVGVQASVTRALFSKAVILGDGGRFDEALATCDDMVLRLSTWPDEAGLEIELALGLSGRGRWLRALGRHDEAVEAYRKVVERFAEGDDPEINARLAFARDVLRQLAAD
ncbi:MAG: repeat-containing protein [Conexibacter sp.]|nr:repeat-containing protein [Conexibacter sp.]